MKLLRSAFVVTALSAPVIAQGGDECTGATPLLSGVAMPFTTSGATASSELWTCVDQAPDLWFEYTTVGTTGDLVVETCGSSYDSALEIFSGTCGALTLEDCNDDACSQQSALSIPLSGPAGTTYYIRVGGFGGASGAGQIVAIEGPAPDCGTPDPLESNTDCLTATVLGDGIYPGLNVEEADNDYYLVTIPPGATLDVSLSFTASLGDVDLYLWDPSIECDTNVAGAGGAYLDRSITTSGSESASYTNATGADLDVIVEVDMYTGLGCNDYSMGISGVGGASGPIGTPYCSANPNSTGNASELAAVGSPFVSSNDVTLTASGLPTFSFGFFIVSDMAGFVANPGGSEGNLCLGGSVGRYVGPGQVMSSLGTGSITLAIDLTSIPRPTGSVATAPGDTWHFQLWHRDSGATGPTSNFTNGRTIVFS